MSEQDTALAPAEWRVMEVLWERAPLTGREITEAMRGKYGWSRSTTLTLLARMEAKEAIAGDAEAGVKRFRPLVRREDVAARETESFLGRIYKGSLSMMVSTFTKKQQLSREEIDELYAILDGLEAKRDD